MEALRPSIKTHQRQWSAQAGKLYYCTVIIFHCRNIEILHRITSWLCNIGSHWNLQTVVLHWDICNVCNIVLTCKAHVNYSIAMSNAIETKCNPQYQIKCRVNRIWTLYYKAYSIARVCCIGAVHCILEVWGCYCIALHCSEVMLAVIPADFSTGAIHWPRQCHCQFSMQCSSICLIQVFPWNAQHMQYTVVVYSIGQHWQWSCVQQWCQWRWRWRWWWWWSQWRWWWWWSQWWQRWWPTK